MIDQTQAPQAGADEQDLTSPNTNSDASVSETGDDPATQIARLIGEDPKRIKKRPDAVEILQLMDQGVLVDLSINYPRFYVGLSAEHLGLASKQLGLESSEQLEQYVQLGRRSLIPKKLRDRISAIETRARQCLYEVALDTPWKKLGQFVPTTKYFQWQEANAEIEKEFWALKEEIVEQYPELVANVLRDHRKLALESWNRLAMGSAVAKSSKSAQQGAQVGSEGEGVEGEDEIDLPPISEEESQLAASALREFQGQVDSRQQFVEEYLSKIRAKMPTLEALQDGFKYSVDLNFIQLPSLLAKDVSKADRIYRERALRDAQFRAETERAEAEHRAEMERIAAEARADAEAAYQRRREEREAEYQKQRTEWERQRLLQEQEQQELAAQRMQIQRRQELLDLQYKMERDVIERNRKRQQELVDQFYNGIVQQLNEAVFDVCNDVLRSLNKNGVMTGRNKLQITNLIKRLTSLNILEDEQIDDQIARLREALETKVEVRASDNTPYERIDTDFLGEVLTSIREEVNETLTDLGAAPSSRMLRSRNALRATAYDDEDEEGELRQASARRSRRAQRVEEVEDDQEETGVAKRRMRVSQRKRGRGGERRA